MGGRYGLSGKNTTPNDIVIKGIELNFNANTNVKTSLLGFGCMRFPTLKDGSIDEVVSERWLVYHAIMEIASLFFNFFDKRSFSSNEP